MSLQHLLDLPGVDAAPEAATRGYVFNHTMIRVKDLARSLDFYTRVLGFVPVHKQDFPEAAFSIVYLVLRADRAGIPDDDAERLRWVLGQPGVLELTHNHGTEDQPDFRYHDGNAEPRGFGHLCVSVPDVKAACERFERLGVPFQKRLADGRMKHIAFIKDPDGYWIEILQPAPFAG
ncbi:lactoylglutathione lyase [Fulvimonas soli]|jgi:lactoylglutathione lyase|uniref:lactoylglutathione lyase n=1 Tax=Fulvimonas soli TaxID=155197 RepID=A0A316IES0_9GAMM|nr:lactoylglutathione lyase [Fulvimonas soli]PWK92107.1 lactoylglutathione lyase [Fulvimonas soli]TNY27837.1 lactoylglutathione lyase [Fulvimonas soli]